jgi:copper chaperone CopZ
MCEKTIETALNATEGVASADYDLGAHMLIVSYDSNAIGLEGLHHACASAGYETRLQPAVPAAYGALPKCCKKMSDQ